jgi:hypothetical protein
MTKAFSDYWLVITVVLCLLLGTWLSCGSVLASGFGSVLPGGEGTSVQRTDWLASGVVDASDISIGFDTGTRTFSIEPSGVSYDYYHNGNKYTITTTLSQVITDTNSIWYFYFNGDSSLVYLTNPTTAQIQNVLLNHTMLSVVLWDSVNDFGTATDSLYGYRMAPGTKVWAYYGVREKYINGMGLGDILSEQDGSSDTHAQFSVATGSFTDCDIVHSLPAATSTTGLEVDYVLGSWFANGTNSGFSILTTGTGRMAYNNAGALAEVTNNSFALTHVIATARYDPSETDKIYIAYMGQAEYGNIADARTGALTEMLSILDQRVALGWQPKAVPVGTVIFQTSNTYTNAVKSRIRQTATGEDWVDFRATGRSL